MSLKKKNPLQLPALVSTGRPRSSTRKCPCYLVDFPGETPEQVPPFDTLKPFLAERAFLIERPGASLTMPPVWVAVSDYREFRRITSPLLILRLQIVLSGSGCCPCLRGAKISPEWVDSPTKFAVL